MKKLLLAALLSSLSFNFALARPSQNPCVYSPETSIKPKVSPCPMMRIDANSL